MCPISTGLFWQTQSRELGLAEHIRMSKNFLASHLIYWSSFTLGQHGNVCTTYLLFFNGKMYTSSMYQSRNLYSIRENFTTQRCFYEFIATMYSLEYSHTHWDVSAHDEFNCFVLCGNDFLFLTNLSTWILRQTYEGECLFLGRVIQEYMWFYVFAFASSHLKCLFLVK